jgi:N-acetyl-gamma-glutamyl-phosphate reductase
MGHMSSSHVGNVTARTPVAVVSGTGYGGIELLRLLRAHPRFELVEVTARSNLGRQVCNVFPQLPDLHLPVTERVERAELVFVALPDAAAVAAVPELLAAGRRVVDLSAGFRLREPALYSQWYGYEHPAPALLETAVYGLPELHRAALKGATLVACPGCYPTAALLALAPALAAGLIEPDIVVDAKSGLSGAGRGPTQETHFAEANEDVAAYGLPWHRHWPEMLQELVGLTLPKPLPNDGRGERTLPADIGGASGGKAAAAPLRLTFTPHLVPMTRGILATCYADLRAGVSADAVRAAYAAFYVAEPFVHVIEQPPHTKYASGTNHAYVYPVVDARTDRLVVLAALDNLGKGAAGQAIQCANVLEGMPETVGLDVGGMYP